MAKYEKVYLNGGGTEKTFEWGSFVNISINLEDAKAKGAIKEVKSEGGSVKTYLNFTIAERREPSEWGQTHSAYISVESGGGKPAGKPAGKASAKKEDDDDLPF
jgi:hypothetical protein